MADSRGLQERLLGFQEKTLCTEIGIKGVGRAAAGRNSWQGHGKPPLPEIQPARTPQRSGPGPQRFPLRRAGPGIGASPPASPRFRLPTQHNTPLQQVHRLEPVTTTAREAFGRSLPAPRYHIHAHVGHARRPHKLTGAAKAPPPPTPPSHRRGIRHMHKSRAQLVSPPPGPAWSQQAVAARCGLEAHAKNTQARSPGTHVSYCAHGCQSTSERIRSG